MNPRLDAFVRDALSRGESRDRIRAALTAARWRAEEVDAALAQWADVEFPVPVPRRDTAISAREAFLYLVLFATLYVATYNTGAILFSLIERWLPDALDRSGARFAGMLTMLRWAVASLVIALPVFLYTNRLIARALAREPEQRVSGVRRWLTYLTLFVAALVLIGDFVVVLRGLLAGELAARFLLKAAVVAGIAGVVFRHYLADLRRDEGEAPAPARAASWLGRAGVAAMAITAVAGLVSVGTPGRARVRELDARRVGDVQEISVAVLGHFGQYGRLPGSLEELAATPVAPSLGIRDPQTHEVYRYAVVDSLHFELCATFAETDSLAPFGGGPSEFWRHGPGEKCYAFEARRAQPVSVTR